MKTSAQKPVVIAAGGTGGHLFPAQALAAELSARGQRIVLMTDPRGHNYSQAFPSADIAEVPSATFAGRSFLGKGAAVGTLAWGAWRAYGLLGRIRPSVVIGFGGYPSLPGLFAAAQRGLPALVHEQNAVLGRVNRFLATRVQAIAASFPAMALVPAKTRAAIVVTGNPVRAAILAAAQPYGAPAPEDPVHLLVFGGSQGARVFSQTVPEAVALLPPELRARLRITQQCRPEDLDRVRQRYADLGVQATLAAFFADMGERMARAHLIVARAGASTVTEIAAAGRPSILVPYPYATDDHQSANARAFADQEATVALPERDLTPDTLARSLNTLTLNPARLTRMAQCAKALARPSAAKALADLAGILAEGGDPAALRAKLEKG
jgi:UDP-N-acetylglucosamine--N-acetylmuramyl-(pentapeptide) pyrophosphoryl-undecaprenol N-acetylglucosamine transferase